MNVLRTPTDRRAPIALETDILVVGGVPLALLRRLQRRARDSGSFCLSVMASAAAVQ